MSENLHKSVLLNESVEKLVTNKNGVYYDATLGRGGHSALLLEKLGKKSKLFVSDVDSIAIEYCKERFQDDKRVIFYNTNFSNIDIIAKIEFLEGFDGIIADLGVSSPQIDDEEYGFTFRKNAKLDLRMDRKIKESAADVLNTYNEADIANIIFKYGEEKNSRKIARLICSSREKDPIKTTFDLVDIIKTTVPEIYLVKTLTRVFQALRIHVNDEFGNLEKFLDKSINLLKPGGIISVITFHSLEDRIVKEKLKKESIGCTCPPSFPICVCGKKSKIEILTKKPIEPSQEELDINKRARSAKLRLARKL